MIKRKQVLSQLENGIFFTLWLVVFISPAIVQVDNNSFYIEEMYSTWIKLLPFFILSLLNHFLLAPRLFFRKKIIWYVISSALSILLFSFVLRGIHQNTQQAMERPPLSQGTHPPGPRPEHRRPEARPMNPEGQRANRPPNPRQNMVLPPVINSMLIALLIMGFDTGFLAAFRWTKSEQDKVKLEKENKESQLAFLRNQVSPHFFMNTLNNIHALIDIDQEEAKESVIQLSKLMRHLLYDSEQKEINLQQEIDFVKSYMALMQLRFSDKVDIKLITPEDLPTAKIPPLLFTSFVENAFKHGISYREKSFIFVKFEVINNFLHFEIKNSVPIIKSKEAQSGIGLQNSMKRLDLLYKNRYVLNIIEENDTYAVKLKLPI